LIRADRAAIARVFGALIPLQPIEWTDDGLVCQPCITVDNLAGVLAACPFPTDPIYHTFAWPDSPAALVAGWYRRSDRHAPAPPGLRELVQVAGEGFGPGDHPTTALCLSALDIVPPAPAVDVGCGSGLLAQAWARRWALHVLAVDVDPAAIAQTNASSKLAGCGHLVEARRQPVQSLTSAELAARVVFANVPASAHRLLISRFKDDPPAAIVLSGLRPHEASLIVSAYQALGLRRVRAARRGRFDCHVLVGRV
jgi:ribosomal protein L11 methyltransferase